MISGDATAATAATKHFSCLRRSHACANQKLVAMFVKRE
jgi:hypothetical protein